jgi:hypothetical protein
VREDSRRHSADTSQVMQRMKSDPGYCLSRAAPSQEQRVERSVEDDQRAQHRTRCARASSNDGSYESD